MQISDGEREDPVNKSTVLMICEMWVQMTITGAVKCANLLRACICRPPLVTEEAQPRHARPAHLGRVPERP
eukprot:scaffold266672_cov27-Tisochrysis_lutea.AAC.1